MIDIQAACSLISCQVHVCFACLFCFSLALRLRYKLADSGSRTFTSLAGRSKYLLRGLQLEGRTVVLSTGSLVDSLQSLKRDLVRKLHYRIMHVISESQASSSTLSIHSKFNESSKMLPDLTLNRPNPVQHSSFSWHIPETC